MLVTYRQPTSEDEAAMLMIYADSRPEDFAMFGWDAAAINSFLRMQLQARDRAYPLQFPKLEDRLIVADGKVAGRLLVDRSGDAIHLVDIAILKRARGRGIGKQAVEQLKLEAAASGKPMRLRVEIENAVAMNLYRKLGFRETRTIGHLTEMEWENDRNEI